MMVNPEHLESLSNCQESAVDSQLGIGRDDSRHFRRRPQHLGGQRRWHGRRRHLREELECGGEVDLRQQQAFILVVEAGPSPRDPAC